MLDLDPPELVELVELDLGAVPKVEASPPAPTPARLPGLTSKELERRITPGRLGDKVSFGGTGGAR